MVLQVRGDLYRLGANEPGSGAHLTLNHLRKTQSQLLEAELAQFDKPTDRLAACEKDWAWAYFLEEITRAEHRVGRVSASAYARSRFDRLGAEIRRLEAQAKTKK